MSSEDTVIRGNKTLISVAAMLAGLMAFVDISIVNVGLNDIRSSFGSPLDRIAWVSTGYAMANITVIPISGWFLKRFGYRRYFTASIAIFTVASVLCGIAWNLPSLVLFRVLQGLGGGAIIPTSQSTLFSRYPERQHGLASALFAIGAITGPLLGPSLGGYLIDVSTWHWVFFINVPLGIIAAAITWTQIEEPGFVPVTSRVDFFGIALLAIGMSSLQYVLEEGNRSGWFESRIIVLLSIVAAISLIAFVSHELETEHCVVDLRVFKNRGYTAATVFNILVGTSLFGGALLFSLYMGVIMHYRARDIGMVFLRGNWVQILIFPVVGKLVTKIDARLLMLLANAALFGSLWLNAHLTAAGDSGTLVTPLLIRGVGIGLGFVPLTLLAVQSLPAAERPGGTALFNLTRELGASIGTAWMTTMLDRNAKVYFTHITSHVNAYSPALYDQQAVLKGSVGRLVDNPEAASRAALNLRISGQALLCAFNSNFMMLAFAFLGATGLIFLMKRPKLGESLSLRDAH